MEKINKISGYVLSALLPQTHTQISLYGDEGMALLYAYAYQITQHTPYLNKVVAIVEESIELLNTKPLATIAVGGGLAGTAWLMAFLSNEGLISYEEDIFQTFDEIILASLQDDLNKKNYDFFHGYLGKCFYFLERQKQHKDDELLEKLLIDLESIGKPINEIRLWQVIHVDGNLTCNLGLSHGIPSILVFFCKLYNLGIQTTYLEKRIREIANWLIGQKQSSEVSYFSYNTTYRTAARLAWCYGDLGVAIALKHAGNSLKDAYLQDVANDIIIHSTQRDILSAGVAINSRLNYAETNFCHGASGIAFIYHNFYKDTQNKAIKIAADYWHEQVEKAFKENEKNIFYTFVKREAKIWEITNGLLEGATGVALALLSEQYPDVKPTWDKFFLLDF